VSQKLWAQSPGKKRCEEKEILTEISANGRGADEDVRNVGELARELGVRPRCLYKWRAKLEALEYQQLKRLLNEKTLEVDFFRGCPSPKSRMGLK